MANFVTGRQILILALLLLLIPVGIVAGQSSANFSAQHSVFAGGGSATSASFSVNGVIGQQVVSVVSSPSFKVSGGFLFPIDAGPDKVWLPSINK